MLGQALFYFDSPWAFHIIKLCTQSTDFGYFLKLLNIETFRTNTYNLKGYNVCGFKWTFFACLKLIRFALMLLCAT